MRINSEILDEYLKNENIIEAQNHNMIHYLKRKVLENHEGESLSYSQEERLLMRRIGIELRQGIEGFIPNNLELWEMLFPNWRELLHDVMVYILIGLPKPYDALALLDENGKPIIVFDVGNWLVYEKLNIMDIVRNLLTHELGHICIYHTYPKLSDIYSMKYAQKLYAISFDEGFAHLLSFENKEMASVNWDEVRFRKIFQESVVTMKEALKETDEIKQETFLESSMTGRYEEKFGAMVGMLYLAKKWLAFGNSGLKATFDEGYAGFLAKIMEENK